MMKNFWSAIRTTVKRPAEPLVMAEIPRPGDDPGPPEPELRAHRGYVQVWLSQMFLATRSTLLANWLPAAHSRVTVRAAGRTTHEYARVLRPDPKEMADGVRLNFELTDLLPYEGGSVEVEAALLGLQAGNNIDVVVDLLSAVSALPVPGLDIATKVSEGARDLVARSNGAVHLNLHQTFTSGGDGGGGAPLRSTYVALVMATEAELAPARLRVNGDRLHEASRTPGEPSRPLSGFDFVLLRVDCPQERPDYWLPDIDEAWQKAISAYDDGQPTVADAYQKAARAAALRSNLLTQTDRRRVIEAVATQWALFDDGGRGLAPGAVARSLPELMQRMAPSVEDAARSGPITASEAFSR